MAGRRTPKITAAWLERVTAFYLERYATTAAHLRRVLLRRVDRIVRESGQEREPAHALVHAEVDRLVRVGAIDDAAFARDRARALHRRGSSALKIRRALGAKGLGTEQVAEAMASFDDGTGEPELDAARVYAKKRRLGPWRGGPADREIVQKELARLGRAGFSYDVARRVLAGEAE